jgi:hypothetical protein
VWARCKKWAAVLSLTGRKALGCQRTLWTVHTESTNSTEIEAVGGGIGQKIARFGGRDMCFLITSRQRQRESLAVSCDRASRPCDGRLQASASHSAKYKYRSGE